MYSELRVLVLQVGFLIKEELFKKWHQFSNSDQLDTIVAYLEGITGVLSSIVLYNYIVQIEIAVT